MNKIFTLFLSIFAVGSLFSQWQPAQMHGTKLRETANATQYYSLDLQQLKAQLTGTPEAGKGTATQISLPTLDGRIERFSVYSFPVVVPELAERFQLESYVGVGIDDPKKYVRFSIAPNDFQSMIIKNGKFEFIEPQNTDKSVYGVHAKTHDAEDGLGFVCSTDEGAVAKSDIAKLRAESQTFPFNQNSTAKIGDQKYRTLRLVISVTGEYTQYFGSVQAALTQINATLTRVNGVYEKEIATHLILQYFPELIYLDPKTDPYSNATTGAGGAWNLELQKTLTSVVGESNYDIGHLFGASGGGGNAGCIGCVCISPNLDANGVATTKQKGSGFTSPADKKPFGDNFDIDYVAHEMGHQLGANHTFSHKLENAGVNMEPGSGTTIMGYAGITGSSTDVQPHSDPYFHLMSIYQIQNNLTAKTCDIERNITNKPPTVSSLPDVTIPKATAFVLTADAADAEKDPLTYSWEELDNAAVPIDKSNLGLTKSGASFRVFNPVNVPYRYFPKFESVMAGVLNNANNTWESVSYIPRATNYGITVRENNPNNAVQQITYGLQKVTVGNDGPFRITNLNVYRDIPASLVIWDVVNTDKAPYNAANVKVDYTTDNGATWTVLTASTPNDGSEGFDFSALAAGTNIKIRVSAIGNVFYTVALINVANNPTAAPDCATLVSPADNTIDANYKSLTLTWTAPAAGMAVESYDVYMDTNPTPTTLIGNTTTTSMQVTNLATLTKYYWRVVPKNQVGAAQSCTVYSFTTSDLMYCEAGATDVTYEKISQVEFAGISNPSTSTGGYEDFTKKEGSIKVGESQKFTATAAKSYSTDQVVVWIDLNQDRDFDDAGEKVFSSKVGVSPYSGDITIPADAKLGKTRMRVRMLDTDGGVTASPCGITDFGQVEDYTLNILENTALATVDSSANSGIILYPNPASDVLNINKVSSKAKYIIYSIAGSKVSDGTLSDGKINVQPLAKGVYVISIDDNGTKFTSKFIKN